MKSSCFTCPLCKRTSYHPMDAFYRYCGACQKFFPPEMGRELKASELIPLTVVILVKEGRDTFGSVWVKGISEDEIEFLANAIGISLYCVRKGEEIFDETARMRVFQYLGSDAPTSGTPETITKQ